MATHSSILAWRIPWTEEPGGLESKGVTKESDTTEHKHNSSFAGWLVGCFKETYNLLPISQCQYISVASSFSKNSNINTK